MRAAILVVAAACTSSESDDVQRSCGIAGEQLSLPRNADEVVDCDWSLGAIHVPDPVRADTLDPLRDLERVDGNLTIFRNHALDGVAALAHLQQVGGTFSIRLDESEAFIDLDGLESLREVGELELSGNGLLASLRGLRALATVRGNVTIRNNPMLPRAEVDWLLARIDVQGTITVDL